MKVGELHGQLLCLGRCYVLNAPYKPLGIVF